MARNLRARLPSEDHLIVHDKNVQATSSFAQEMGGSNVVIATSVREVAEKSVRDSLSSAKVFLLDYDTMMSLIS